MAKLVVGVCHYCGKPIFKGERHKVSTKEAGVHRYHYDHGHDCLAEEARVQRMLARMEAEYEEVDYTVGRGDE